MASMSIESWDCDMEDKDLEMLEVPAVLDGTLLMELLEESDADEAEDDRLRFLMRSLEAEIGHVDPTMISDGESTTSPHGDSKNGGLEDILSDFDSYDGSRSSAYLVDDPFDLVDMEVGDGMGGSWCMEFGAGEGGMVGYGEPEQYGGFHLGEGAVEQVYSPLWH